MTKIKLLLSLNYRFEFFINLLVQLILLFTSSLFWKAAFKGVDTVEMINEKQMLTYSIMSIILSSVFVTSVEYNIRGKVYNGNVAVDYIKPVNVFLMYFSEDIGNMATSIIQRVIPILVFSCLFITVPKPASAVGFVLFIISSFFSFLILWFISAIIGLLYFKFIDLGPFGNIKDYLIKILSGTFIPVWFFPKPVQTVLQFLPFIYTYQLPLGIFIGKTGVFEALTDMFIQIIWISFFALIFARLKKRMEQKIFVQGG